VTTDKGEELSSPRVTRILQDTIAKPALISWAANQERTLVTDAAVSAFAAVRELDVSKVAFVTALKERLGQERAHVRQLEKAGNIGTLAHKMIEWTLREEMDLHPGPKPELPPPSQLAFDAWRRWRETVQLTPMLLEQRVFYCDDDCLFAGTLDFYGTVQGVPTIIDWKTSSGIYPEAQLQLAAYWAAFKQRKPDTPVEQAMIVRLPKKEKDDAFETLLLDAAKLEECYQRFRDTYRLWAWLEGQKKGS